MRVLQKTYRNNTIRYLELPENGLLLNTRDVLVILGVADRPQGTALAEPCLDLTSAEMVALESDLDFAEWLMREFGGYNRETGVLPNCTDDWNFG
jgi:hypothetical protein